MNNGLKASYNRFGLRLIALFGACALLPFILFTAVTFRQVTSGMEKQYGKRLEDMAKTVGMSIYERLLLLDSNLKIIASELNEGKGYLASARGHQLKHYDQWFCGIARILPNGGKITLFGKLESIPELPVSGPGQEEGDKTLVLTGGEKENLRIFMLGRIDHGTPDKGFVVAELNPTFLWGIGPAKSIPLQTNICVIDQRRNILINSLNSAGELLGGLARHQRNQQFSRYFSFKHERADYLAGYWSIFLRSGFAAPDWTVVLSQDKGTLLEPLSRFKRDFPLFILLSVLIAILLGMVHIRRSLVPMQRLKEGTERLALGDFTAVEITSGDEFADLADSFNRMSAQLSRQFNTLTTIGEIDRAILSSLNSRDIVSTMLGNMYEFLHCRLVAIAMLDKDDQGELSYCLADGRNYVTFRKETVRITAEEIQELLDIDFIIVGEGEQQPPYLSALRSYDVVDWVTIPVLFQGKLAGVFVLGYGPGHLNERRDDIAHARHLGAQLSVALANSHLVEELEKLSWGAIKALGRSVDAKSSWTAGHSERVTSYALQIAQALPLPEERLKALHRAALLHDIGKLGISVEVLDKPASLTAEEYGQIKNHPALGARILEPIAAFKEIIPIILQHHECYDGSGYPGGLRGEEIIIEARILAVADVFDALFSVRPYRDKWNREKIVDYLHAKAGSIFDPQVIDLFLDLLERDEIVINPLTLVE